MVGAFSPQWLYPKMPALVGFSPNVKHGGENPPMLVLEVGGILAQWKAWRGKSTNVGLEGW